MTLRAGSRHAHECGPDTCGFATFEERMAIRDEVEPTIPDPPPFVGNERCQDSAKARVVMIATEFERRGLQVDVTERWDALVAERDRYRQSLEIIDSVLTTVKGDNLPRGEACKSHARGLARTALGRKP